MKNITTVYFSPTGRTKEAYMALASTVSRSVKEVNLCIPSWEWTFDPGDAVVVGIPVSGSRIPRFAVEELKHCRGNGMVAATAAACGNRAFEDTFSGLGGCLRAQGFRIAVGTTLLAEYLIVGNIASGRPGEQDMEDTRPFAAKILDGLQEEDWQEPQVLRDCPYRDWKQMPVVLVTNDSCTACGRCVRLCSAGVVPLGAPGTAKIDQCILRMRCVFVCPTQARGLPAPALLMLEQKLSSVRDTRRENELFLQIHLSDLSRKPALRACSGSLPCGFSPG